MLSALLSPLAVGSLSIPNRLIMSAPDSLPGRCGPGTDRADGRVLPAARRRRPDHQRGHLSQPARSRLPRHPGHLVRRADQGLAAGYRCGARRRRADLPAAVARRPHLRPRAAGRRPAGRAECDPSGRPGPTAPTRPPLRDASSTGDRRDRRDRRRLPPRRGERPACRVRRRGDPRRQRLPDRPVPARQHQSPHRRLRRIGGEPGPVPAGDHRSGQ